jgi:predicted transcriptional regulator
MRQYEACEYAVKDSVSIKKALTVFYWLRDKGFIRKTGKSYYSPFEATEKGKLFYKVLSFDDVKISY